MKRRLLFPRQQQGVVLLVALIMLLMVTLLVVSGFNLTQTNLQVVHNLESRALTKQAGIRALEQVMSSNLFLSGNVFGTNCEEANRVCYDVNADGVDDVGVRVVVSCSIAEVLSNDEVQARSKAYTSAVAVVDPDAVEMPGSSPWNSCFSVDQSGQINGASNCAGVVWDFVATATDLQTGAQVQVRQGLATPADITQVATLCN